MPPLLFACSADATSVEARPKKVRTPVSTTTASISPRLTTVPYILYTIYYILNTIY